MAIDVTTISYSDAMIYLEDYLSDSPIFDVTDDEYYAISLNFNIPTQNIYLWETMFLIVGSIRVF